MILICSHGHFFMRCYYIFGLTACFNAPQYRAHVTFTEPVYDFCGATCVLWKIRLVSGPFRWAQLLCILNSKLWALGFPFCVSNASQTEIHAQTLREQCCVNHIGLNGSLRSYNIYFSKLFLFISTIKSKRELLPLGNISLEPNARVKKTKRITIAYIFRELTFSPWFLSQNQFFNMSDRIDHDQGEIPSNVLVSRCLQVNYVELRNFNQTQRKHIHAYLDLSNGNVGKEE